MKLFSCCSQKLEPERLREDVTDCHLILTLAILCELDSEEVLKSNEMHVHTLWLIIIVQPLWLPQLALKTLALC